MRILLVDDDVELRRELTKELRNRGFYVVEAGSVAEASPILKRRFFHAVVSDFQMPGEEGTRLSHRNWPTPVIIVTGVPEKALLPSAMASIAGFVSKPIDMENLEFQILVAVERHSPNIVRKWLARRQKR